MAFGYGLHPPELAQDKPGPKSSPGEPIMKGAAFSLEEANAPVQEADRSLLHCIPNKYIGLPAAEV
jgi:hypothetical protein